MTQPIKGSSSMFGKLYADIITLFKEPTNWVIRFSVAGLILFTIMVMFLAMLSPICVIWAINTLFGTSIAFTFKTWLAMYILLLVWYQINASGSK